MKIGGTLNSGENMMEELLTMMTGIKWRYNP